MVCIGVAINYPAIPQDSVKCNKNRSEQVVIE